MRGSADDVEAEVVFMAAIVSDVRTAAIDEYAGLLHESPAAKNALA
jgi:hypothetical protein